MQYDAMILIPIFNNTLNIEDVKPKLNCQDTLTKTLMKNVEPELHKTFFKDLDYFKVDETHYIIDDIKIPCNVYLFYDRQSNIGTLQLYLEQIDVDPTRIAHFVDNNDVYVEDNGESLDYEEYVNKFGLEVWGDCRCLFNIEVGLDENTLKAIIAGGTNQRMEMNEKEYSKIKLEKIDVFEDWIIYAGRKDVIQLNKSSKLLDNYNEWIVYQTSISMMQYTAVYKANKNIEKELMYKHSIDEEKSLKILEEFGLCNNLYSCNMYSHPRSKQVAERLRDIFDTDERFALYKDNKELLFDIAELRSDMVNKKENDLLLIFTVIVGASGILDLFADWLEKGPLLDYIIGVPSVLTIIWTIWMLWKLRKHK